MHYKRYEIMKILVDIDRPSQETFVDIAIKGDLKAFQIVKHISVRHSTLSCMLHQAMQHGHVRMYKRLWTSMSDIAKSRAVKEMNVQNPITMAC